ncbi:hypothetical protein MHBO_001638 [Bonamia ostreae]|uniref:Uncharacterized protein n=1 Tax=Bonamia ostreae TaxID=126728 RepID=A0ABV2AJN7_9EUKA
MSLNMCLVAPFGLKVLLADITAQRRPPICKVSLCRRRLRNWKVILFAATISAAALFMA